MKVQASVAFDHVMLPFSNEVIAKVSCNSFGYGMLWICNSFEFPVVCLQIQC
mgnify:CR=1 FL=1